VPAAAGLTSLDAVNLTYNADHYGVTAGNFTTSSDFVASYKLTASAWFKIPDFTNRRSIFTIRTNLAPLLFAVNTNGTIRLLAGNSSGYFCNTTTPIGSAISLNVWNHVVWSIDATDTNKRYVYINGVQIFPTWSTNTTFTWLSSSSSYSAGICFNPDGGTTGGEAGVDLSQIWIDNSYTDLSTNLSKFYNNGPVDMGSNGTGSGLAQPLLYHYGDTDTATPFQTNRGRTASNKATYTFTVTGSPSDVTGPEF
jgi:hypothetical protein